MLITIIAFIIIFSVLVLVHEWGHFAAARKSGIHVEEFGIGLPPQAKKLYKDKKGTVYSLNWIPFGGFVRLFGENSYDPKILKDKKSFASKNIWQRSLVILAGVAMNFLLAWVLITIGFTLGMQPFIVDQTDINKGIKNGSVEVQKIFYVKDIKQGSPLSKTDIKSGDYIISVNGISLDEKIILKNILKPNSQNIITYIHSNQTKTLNVIPDKNGEIGISYYPQDLLNIKKIKYPFYVAPVKALNEIWRLSVLTVKMLGNVVSSIVAKFTVPEGVAGPVGIFKMTAAFAEKGIMALIQFTALLSISLGVINVMPFPALDGGRFLFIIFEAISRKKPNAKWETVIHTIGFALLMLFIVIITWNDIVMMFG